MASATRGRLVKFNMRIVNRKNRIAERKAQNDLSREMERALKKKIGIQGPPRSRPGQPPRKETGRLHADLAVTRSGRTITVRTMQYGIYLDGGTRKMAARPWIRSTIHDKRAKWDKRMAALYRKYNK